MNEQTLPVIRHIVKRKKGVIMLYVNRKELRESVVESIIDALIEPTMLQVGHLIQSGLVSIKDLRGRLGLDQDCIDHLHRCVECYERTIVVRAKKERRKTNGN